MKQIIKKEVFQSPYNQYAHKNGQEFEIISEVPHSEFDYEEVGTMYKIKFKDGEIITAWPEEITTP